MTSNSWRLEYTARIVVAHSISATGCMRTV